MRFPPKGVIFAQTIMAHIITIKGTAKGKIKDRKHLKDHKPHATFTHQCKCFGAFLQKKSPAKSNLIAALLSCSKKTCHSSIARLMR